LKEAAYGPDHGAVVDPLRELGALLDRDGRHEEAWQYLSRAQQIAAKPGLRNISIVPVDEALGSWYLSDGQFARALDYFEQGQRGLEQRLKSTDGVLMLAPLHFTHARVLLRTGANRDRVRALGSQAVEEYGRARRPKQAGQVQRWLDSL
jgi:hypothetical protein